MVTRFLVPPRLLVLKNERVWNLTLAGHVPAKKNAFKIILLPRKSDGKRVGRLAMGSSSASDIVMLTVQIPSAMRGLQLEHPMMTILFHHWNGAEDRDGKLTTILDILQKTGTLRNDNKKRFNNFVVIYPSLDAKKGRDRTEITLVESTRLSG